MLAVSPFSAYRLWTPADLGSNLTAWYSADNGVVSGNEITRLYNMSSAGSTLDMLPAVAGQNPIYSPTGFNGYPSMKFATGKVFLCTSNVSYGQIFFTSDYDYPTVNIEYCSPVSGGSYTISLSSFSNPVNWHGSLGFQLGERNGIWPLAQKQNRNALPMNNDIWSFAHSTGLAQSATFMKIGTDRGNISDRFWEGDLCDVIYVGNQLSEADYYRVTGYLAHKRNLVGKLPVDHPYKNSPPFAY